MKKEKYIYRNHKIWLETDEVGETKVVIAHECEGVLEFKAYCRFDAFEQAVNWIKRRTDYANDR